MSLSVLSARPVPGHPGADDESKLDELEAKQITWESPIYELDSPERERFGEKSDDSIGKRGLLAGNRHRPCYFFSCSDSSHGP